MTQTRIETSLEQNDLDQLQKWVADGQFTDLADAIQCAVHAAVNLWRYDEFVKWEKEKYGGMTDDEFNKALAEEGMGDYLKLCPPY